MIIVIFLLHNNRMPKYQYRPIPNVYNMFYAVSTLVHNDPSVCEQVTRVTDLLNRTLNYSMYT